VERLTPPTVLGLAATAALLVLSAALGRVAGREPSRPWVCDDTRYVDTVPAGRAVVGPAVSAPPGCGR
jgi:hypothetical protein